MLTLLQRPLIGDSFLTFPRALCRQTLEIFGGRKEREKERERQRQTEGEGEGESRRKSSHSKK